MKQYFQTSAFPVQENAASRGMTLRDYFASAALQGILSNSSNHELDGKTMQDWYNEIPSIAYGYADAMLQAREQK